MLLAALAAMLALAAGYARRAVVDSDQFANRATAALEDPDVRALISARVADEVLAQEPDLIAVRPLIESVAGGVVGGGAFTGVFRSAVRDVHRALIDRDQDTLTLTLRDVGVVLAGALQAVRPELADELRRADDVSLLTRDTGPVGGDLVRAADRIRLLAWLLLAVAVACAAGALALSRDRRATTVALGGAFAAAGVVLVVAYALGRSLAVGSVQGAQERDAAAAVWDAFLSDLRAASWILAASGAVVAAAAASLLRPLDVAAIARGAARAVQAEPTRPALRVLRAAALVATGLALLLARDAVLALVLGLAGVLLIAAGTSELLRMTYRPRPAAPERPEHASRRRRPLIAAAVATVLVGGAVAVFAGSGAATTAAPPAGPCNGHAELCDRSLPEVALPATHNSMSAPLPGWYAALVDGPIAQQLADGVRGLLIDTHYADLLPNGRLRTDATRIELIERAKQDGVSEEAVAAALRLRGRAGFDGEGERGMYLCHTFCELGGTELGSVLEDLHDFLAANPGEVRGRRQPGLRDAAGLGRGHPRRRARAVRLHPATVRQPVADVAADDRLGSPAVDARRERGRRRALVPARLRRPPAGDAVLVPARGAAARHGEPRCDVRAQPRAGGRAAVPRQPLGDHGPAPAPVGRRRRQRLPAAPRPAARVRADPRSHPQPRRGQLPPARRPLPRRRRPQRRPLTRCERAKLPVRAVVRRRAVR